jgi:hypothetical protein
MIHSKNRIHRRTLLRGAGGMAIGLPFLSAMLPPGRSHAQEMTPKRLVIFYNPGGTLLDKWRPMGGTTDFTLQPMMASLTPFRDRLVFLGGLNMDVTSVSLGHPHSRGMGAVLTGRQLLSGNYNTNGGNAGFAAGASIDQVIAPVISNGLRFPSLQVSAGWSTGISAGGQPHPGNVINYLPPTREGGAATPVAPSTDPFNTMTTVFSGVGDNTEENARVLAWNTSILDGARDDFNRLSMRLGAEDREKLQAHMAFIEQTRAGLQQGGVAGCVVPTMSVDPTPGFYDDPIAEGVSRGGSDGGNMSITTGMKVPLKGKAMIDILVAALACDLTRVGTMQYSDSEAKFMLGFLQDGMGQSLKDHHHGYQHDRGFQPAALEVIYRFYMEQFAYLLERMDAVVEGEGTMLDNSLVLAISEIQHPDSHNQNNMPFILAGKAGGILQTQRWLQLNGQPHNNLLVSILNMFGLSNTTFGHPDFCTGPVSGLV